MLDQASEDFVERPLSRVSPETDRLRAMYARVHCQHAASIGLTSKHWPFFLIASQRRFITSRKYSLFGILPCGRIEKNLLA
jgi:hypothetical protein